MESVEFFCQVVRQGVQKEWVQSKVRFGVPSTQMGQGSFSAVVVSGGGEVEVVFDGDGCVEGELVEGAVVSVVVVAAAAVAVAIFFSEVFSASNAIRR